MGSGLERLACLALAAFVTGSSGGLAEAGVPHARAAILAPPPLRLGQSVGSPTDGHLLGGTRLEEAAYLRLLPAYAESDARWGLGTLISMIDRSARAVRRLYPDAVLSVGQISRRGGGDIDRHASHESGRDADLSFYIRSQTGHPLYSDHMVPFRGDGSAPSWPGAFFDDARNWALVSAIVQETHARVTYIFVAAPLRARLLAYAARTGAPPAVRSRAAELMVQPRGSLPHDDHFHVRIGCPTAMTACVELPTRAGSTRVMARRGRAPSGGTATTLPTKRTAGSRPNVPLPPAPAADTPVAPDAVTRAPDAVLATPFDDVDGPVEPGSPFGSRPGSKAERVEIQ